ncbi:MAG: serine/threonine protein kinase [Planctomycetota bacterium]|jgi:serine/threonine-protein kinase
MGEKKQVKIPGYKILSLLGKGVQGAVYKGMHEASTMPVAIKVLSSKWAKVPEFKERFHREYASARALSHPNIVKGLKAGEIEGILFYIMEFADGKPLNELVDPASPLKEAAVLTMGIQAASALAHAHAHKVIHRDIKPGNFIISSTGRLKLLDLGLAKLTAAKRELTLEGSVFGTPSYISPEAVHDSKKVDARSDVYSLGATLYEAAVGQPPFFGDNAILIMEKVCKEPVPPLRERNPKISSEFERVILHAMAKDPGERYATAAEMQADLERVKNGEEPLAPAPPPSPAKTPKTRPPSGRRNAVRSGRPSSRRSRRSPGVMGRILRWFGLGPR